MVTSDQPGELEALAAKLRMTVLWDMRDNADYETDAEGNLLQRTTEETQAMVPKIGTEFWLNDTCSTVSRVDTAREGGELFDVTDPDGDMFAIHFNAVRRRWEFVPDVAEDEDGEDADETPEEQRPATRKAVQH